MLKPYTLYRPHRDVKCWICSATNPSPCIKCDRCKGVTIPTRDLENNYLKWTVFSFGSEDSQPGWSPSDCFDEAMEILETRDRVVIRIATEHKKAILVKWGQHKKTFYSVMDVGKEGKEWEAETFKWNGERDMLKGFLDEK